MNLGIVKLKIEATSVTRLRSSVHISKNSITGIAADNHIINNQIPILEIQDIRKIYKKSEQVSLVVMLLALPVFGIIYLFFESGDHLVDVPEIPEFLVWVIALICIAVLVAQYILFDQKIKLTFKKEDLIEKVKIYSQATIQRYLILLVASLMCSLGLLLSHNPVFTLFFAITLTFFSLAKPTPDRMARLMKLKKEQMELIRAAARPEIPDSDK